MFARGLLEKFPALPVIASPLASGAVEYVTSKGTHQLPQDAPVLLGASHPYREAVAEDLERLMRHESRGDLVVFGWAAGYPAISFSNENGAHAGFGPRETQAFTILPSDAPLQKKAGEWLRVQEFRQAALLTRGKIKKERSPHPSIENRAPQRFRVLSYNVHSCVGMDGVLSVDRIARVIAKAEPDIVALQELDSGHKIEGEDQAAAIARKLEMHFHFHAVCGTEPQCFGNAIFSRFPIKRVRAEHLPVLKKHALFEPRGVLWVELEFQGRPIHVVTTHLSIWAPEQRLQVKKLLSKDILGHPELAKEAILCGDFNMTPGSKFYPMITQHFQEPRFPQNPALTRNTWTSQWPIRRLDYIFSRGELDAEVIALPRTRLEIYASDHLPVAVDFELKMASVG